MRAVKNKVEKKNLFKFDPAVADVLVAAEDRILYCPA